MINNKATKEELSFTVTNHFRVQFFVGIVLSIMGIAISFVLPSFAAFKTYCVTQSLFQPMCVALSCSYTIVFMLESRRLVMFSLICVRPILQLFMEIFGYSFQSTTTENTPTTVGCIVSYLIVAIWIVFLNFGKSALGVTNLQEFPLRDVFKTEELLSKKFFSDFGQLMVLAINGLSNVASCAAVIICAVAVQNSYTDSAMMEQMFLHLFTFTFFGIVFRCGSTALNGLYTQLAIQNTLVQKYSRLISTMLILIIVSAIINVLLYLLFSSADLLRFFIVEDLDSVDLSSTILYSTIAGFGQSFVEVAVTQNLVDQTYYVLIILPILKIVQVILCSSYSQTQIGDEADYVQVLFFTEMNSAACAFVIVVVNIATIWLKQRKTKTKASTNKSLTLEEQLAEIK